MAWDVAAALPEQWQTAYQLLFKVAGLPFALTPGMEGETVLVFAAGSGVGTAAIQLLRATGRRAIAVAGADAKLDMARSLGAIAAFNYKTEEDWAGA
jgi:NADPH:quinone reductase-like Zn-dependent oxidoreductase